MTTSSRRVLSMLLGVCLIVVSCIPTSAQLEELVAEPDRGNPAILAVNRSFSLSYLRSYLYYVEPSDSDAFINGGTLYDDYEYGYLNGARGAISFMGPEDFYLHAEYSYSEAIIDYTGYYQITFQPANLKSRATTQEFHAKIGKGIVTGDRWMLTPYGTVGRRYWVRDAGVGSGGDIIESYSFLYWGAGTLVQYNPWDRWVFTGDAMIGRTQDPSINIDGFSMALGTAPIIKLGLEADYQAVGPLHFFAGFDYTNFSFGQSSPQFGIMEPISHTQVYNMTAGIRLGLGGSSHSSDFSKTVPSSVEFERSKSHSRMDLGD